MIVVRVSRRVFVSTQPSSVVVRVRDETRQCHVMLAKLY